MILYKKYQLKSGLESAKNKWYARPVVNETLNIEALAKHMSDHNTPFSPGVIRGVLTDMVACIKELILDGKNVKLDDLAHLLVRHRTRPRSRERRDLQDRHPRERRATAGPSHRRTEQQTAEPGSHPARTRRVQRGPLQRRHRHR